MNVAKLHALDNAGGAAAGKCDRVGGDAAGGGRFSWSTHAWAMAHPLTAKMAIDFAAIFFHATHETPARRLAQLARGALRDLQPIAASATVEEARLRRGVLADRVVRTATAADSDPALPQPAEAAVNLLALGASVRRLVPLRRVGAPAGAAEGPVAAALTTVHADVHHPAICANALEHAAESLEQFGSALATVWRRG